MINKLSYAEALDEFEINIKEDDYDFWFNARTDKGNTRYMKAFYEWCSNYEDTKHLTSESK